MDADIGIRHTEHISRLGIGLRIDHDDGFLLIGSSCRCIIIIKFFQFLLINRKDCDLDKIIHLAFDGLFVFWRDGGVFAFDRHRHFLVIEKIDAGHADAELMEVLFKGDLDQNLLVCPGNVPGLRESEIFGILIDDPLAFLFVSVFVDVGVRCFFRDLVAFLRRQSRRHLVSTDRDFAADVALYHIVGL